MIDQECRAFRPDYDDHGVLFCWENGKPPHPDTITRRFKKLSRVAGLPAIDLNDAGHSYATAGRNTKIGWKALSKRIGHAGCLMVGSQLPFPGQFRFAWCLTRAQWSLFWPRSGTRMARRECSSP